ncbi:polysaccharide deacetylase family protein [Cohnella panacarvi]|uniref:polysaccharide deacetylase family protein n=1 Tax=Cohnella panacarvi TaxID=400776 RepID=UPI0004AF472B|nr:polysaccharide deacetylase family protein [Cohnella panacarvi]
MELILWFGIYFLTFYAFLPAIVSRLFGFRVFMRGKSETEIALTFDDGPDPEYTPKLLDLLKSRGAKATFFVVGENAEKHPDIIARIHEEGHLLAIHNYVHNSNWFMRPSAVKKQIQRTSDVIERITGTKPKYYRPPWGIVNLFDFASKGRVQIVLWTSMFGDWSAKVGADKLYRRMRSKLKPGEVFLLHDCGTTFGADRDAPAHTIAALSRILEDGREQGLKFVGIDELIASTEARRSKIGLLKKVVVSLWLQYEKLFHVVFRLQPVGDGKSFNYRVRKYAGPPVELHNAVTLRSGDSIMEIHFENKMMFEMGMNARNTMQIGIRIIREVEKALPDLGKQLSVIPNGDKVKALYGVSMIHRGAESLGFQVFDLPRGLFAWATNIYLRILIRVIHPSGNERVKEHGQSLEPRMLLMSRDILQRWAVDPDARRHLRPLLHK